MKGSIFSVLLGVLVLLTVSQIKAAEEGGLPLTPLPIFTCQPYEYSPDEVATNVNQVRPHDVKVVISMGDSMTAAFAATSGPILDLPFIPREDRYLSYGVGAGSMRYTLHNFLKVYSPNIQGGATGSTLPINALFGLEPVIKALMGLDVAISGAIIQDIPDQINYVVEELTTGSYAGTVDFQNDWKVITLLIGANNLCDSCYNETTNTPETYAKLMNESIAQIYEQIPRVRLNILPMFNITQVYYWAQANEYCTRVWKLLDECPCLSSKDSNPTWRRLVNENALEYRRLLTEIVDYWQTNVISDSFAVTIQPFSENLMIVNGLLTSDFDCFHPSALTNDYLGAILWNSILTPPDQKPTNATAILLDGFEFICPDRNTYLQ